MISFSFWDFSAIYSQMKIRVPFFFFFFLALFLIWVLSQFHFRRCLRNRLSSLERLFNLRLSNGVGDRKVNLLYDHRPSSFLETIFEMGILCLGFVCSSSSMFEKELGFITLPFILNPIGSRMFKASLSGVKFLSLGFIEISSTLSQRGGHYLSR